MYYTKRNYKQLAKVVRSMKGFQWLGNGYAEYKGQEIDLTATAETVLAVAYTTLYQLADNH
jgi:hypothetical protein